MTRFTDRSVSRHVFAALAAVMAVACSRQAGAPPSIALEIALHEPHGDRPAYVEVSGLSPSERSSLNGLTGNGAGWQSLLKVTVGEVVDDSLPPVQGRYAATEAGLTFTPLFPFDPGRAYVVRFDPARLPTPRQAAAVSQVVRLAAPERHPAARVTAVYPDIAVLPENTLRLYIEFSAPMGNGAAVDFVRLLDERGQEVPFPFLPVEADFWNRDHTRYTLFFDPGRVKQGILPNRESGRPLQAGREYTIQVSAEWRDADHQPLAAAYSRKFRAGRPETRPIAMSAWRITTPSAGTRNPLVVAFPATLDHGLLERALGVQTADGGSINGEAVLNASDTRWTFTPRLAWEAGGYDLVALAILEDPAGNRIGRAFEVDMTRPSGDSPADVFRVPFRIGGTGS